VKAGIVGFSNGADFGFFRHLEELVFAQDDL
jgi:hypothetical protein